MDDSSLPEMQNFLGFFVGKHAGICTKKKTTQNPKYFDKKINKSLVVF